MKEGTLTFRKKMGFVTYWRIIVGILAITALTILIWNLSTQNMEQEYTDGVLVWNTYILM